MDAWIAANHPGFRSEFAGYRTLDDMTTLTENIASWEYDFLASESQFARQDSIATEAQQKESPAWEECIDALLKIWADPSTLGEGFDSQPKRSAIEAAVAWIAVLRKRFPGDPPTCITPEPDGGIIVERRVQLADGHDCLCELTFYNNGTAERTDYFDGRILDLRQRSITRSGGAK